MSEAKDGQEFPIEVKCFLGGAVTTACFIAAIWLFASVGTSITALTKSSDSNTKQIEKLSEQNGLSKEYWDKVSVQAKLAEKTAFEALQAANQAHKRIERIEDFLEEEEAK